MGRPPIGKTAMSGAERVARYRLKHGADPRARREPAPQKLQAEIAALKQELAQAKALIGKMQLEQVAFRDELKRRPAKAEKPPLPPDEARDRRIKALTTQVQNLKAHVLQLVHMHAAELAKVGGMPFALQSAIAKCLHSDSRKHVTEVHLDETLKAFTAWKADKDKAQRKAR